MGGTDTKDHKIQCVTNAAITCTTGTLKKLKRQLFQTTKNHDQTTKNHDRRGKNHDRRGLNFWSSGLEIRFNSRFCLFGLLAKLVLTVFTPRWTGPGETYVWQTRNGAPTKINAVCPWAPRRVEGFDFDFNAGPKMVCEQEGDMKARSRFWRGCRLHQIQ